MDSSQIEENITLEEALRRANLLAAAAEVSHNITQILDIDELLPKTVDVICNAYDFYYAGVFLIDEAGEFAVLRAGRGEPGRIMIENKHKLAVGGNSMIGASTARNEARISLDVDTEKVWYPNPVLPETRSEMALPLAVGDQVMGAVTVQSTEAVAFSDEDISSLQAMANQLAVAIDNARKQRELEQAQAELVRTKTFEAIATATGDAIHWIGNKAEPISGTIKRIRHDVQLLACATANLLKQAQLLDDEFKDQPLAQLLLKEAMIIQQSVPDIDDAVEKLSRLPLDELERRLSLALILEDLEIVDDAARLIMRVKEDLIGPAREQAPRPTMIDDVAKDAISELGLWSELVEIDIEAGLPLILADPVQLNRVFVNLLKNAQEALEGQPDPQIRLSFRTDAGDEFVLVDMTDNGVGIPASELDKIWITFHSTKGVKDHTGLGLPACRLILEQIGGHISVASQPGKGSTFTVGVPINKNEQATSKEGHGRGKVLIIDDNDPWRQFAADTLKAKGYSVALSGDNYMADKYNHYDLILIDDILANGDSWQVLQTINEAGVISKTVAVSSNPRVERAKVRKMLGVCNLIPKPYTQNSLLIEIKSALMSIRSSQS